MIHTARYAHLKNSPDLSVGSTVRPGQIIATMGNSGQSTAPHVHFDLIQTAALDKIYRLYQILSRAAV